MQLPSRVVGTGLRVSIFLRVCSLESGPVECLPLGHSKCQAVAICLRLMFCISHVWNLGMLLLLGRRLHMSPILGSLVGPRNVPCGISLVLISLGLRGRFRHRFSPGHGKCFGRPNVKDFITRTQKLGVALSNAPTVHSHRGTFTLRILRHPL